jgi:hypothetical protein
VSRWRKDLTGLGVHVRGLPFENIRHEPPALYRYGLAGETEEEFATRMAADLEKMILDEGPDTVAAFIAEPVMGAGGVLTPPKTYFEKVQAVLKKYDVLFIADEVICGFHRTGNTFTPPGPTSDRAGALGLLPADRRRDDHGADLQGTRERQRRGRQLGPRLYL